MTVRPLFLAMAAIAFVGFGCSNSGDFTYSKPNPRLPPAVLSGDVPAGRQEPSGPMTLTSSAFQNGGEIPELYTCNGSDFSPPVEFGNIPLKASGLALIAEDKDAPEGFAHWVVFNMPYTVASIPEGEAPPGAVGLSTNGRNGYEGPCPPDGVHHYVFTLYAVDGVISLEQGASKDDLVKALDGHVVSTAVLEGTYGKQ